jgi:plasmid stabilization system protein ParE
MNVVWTPLAEARVAHFIGSMRADRTGAAWRWLQSLLARVRGLSRSARDRHAGAATHEIFFDPCRVVYRIETRRIVILTVRPVAEHRKSARYAERPRGSPAAARGRP